MGGSFDSGSMTSAHVYIGTSLDGYIARTDGDISWLINYADADAVEAYNEFTATVDVIVIGRGTFETVLGFPLWPYDKPVFVLSKTLKDLPDSLSKKATISSLEPGALLRHLSDEGFDAAYIDGGKVIGLELLIQGLSGKFISSVVALLCATAFIFLEKRWFYSLEKSRQQLVNALDRLFPQLSSVQMLVNVQNGMLHWQSQLMSGIGHVQSGISHFQTQLVSNLNNFQIKLMESVDNLQANTKSQNSLQKQLVENLDKFQIQLISNVSALKDNIENQTVCIQDFNTSLAPMLQQTFDESMTPTMNRMVKAIEDMNELLRASEANKSDSISETIERLLKNLQDSMTRSIDQMSNAFSKSLSGSAQEQFEKIATTLSGTATMLDAMNTQFAGTQNDMRQLIEHARTATNEQIKFGQVQLGDLKAVMQAFMGEMSTRVNELSNEMNASLERNVGNAAQMANNVAVQAEEWTKQNGIQVSQMLAAQETQLAQINQMRETLAITTTQLTQSMQGISHIATTTQLSVEVINKTAAALEGAALSGQKTQTNLQRIADASAVQVAELRNANQQQVAVWQGINASMRQYEQTFGSVEGKASELLQEVTTSLENYQQVCAGGFAKLVSISDEHFSNAAQKLGASVGELDEHLQDLSEIFEKVNGAKTNGNRIRQ